tara:strand:+ start:255 stop:578 length:324 start_codon:yes stop_codon:yes gene_type:complete
MSWENILKRDTGLLASISNKDKKKLKKTLQSAEPSEFFGKDFTHLGNLVEMLEDMDLIKGDKKMQKKMKGYGERNLDIVATAAKLRKEYELLYFQLRGMVYPKRKGD